MKHDSRISRRRAMRLAGAAVAAVPVAALVGGRVAWAEEQPKLDPESPQAKGLGYHHDSSQVDAAKWPAWQEGRLCSDCQLYQGGPDAQWGPCSIFPGKNVNADGWCSAWVPTA